MEREEFRLDDLPTGWLIAGGVGMLVVRTMLGVADSNLVLLNRARVKQRAEEGDARSRRLDDLLEDRHRLHACLAMCRTTLSILLGALAVWIAKASYPHNLSAQGLTLLATVVGVLFLEILSRRLAWVDPERLALTLLPFYVLVDRVASPLVGLFGMLTTGMARLAGRPHLARPVEREVTGEDIRLLVESGHDLEESEKEMLTSIFELSETLAREIMVPRVDMIAVDVTASLERVLELCAERGLSRLPVYQGSVDDVVGVVLTKDLIGLVKESRMDTPLRELLRPAHFVPGSKKVDELLREMQRDKIAMAIVVDEYGGTDGLITMEDLVEEIVGEITDEYDTDVQTLELLDDGSVTVDARMNIEDVNGKLDLSLPWHEYETLGGYVYGLLGHVPAEGECTRAEGLDVQVEEVQGQRITRIRLRRVDRTPFLVPVGHGGARTEGAPTVGSILRRSG